MILSQKILRMSAFAILLSGILYFAVALGILATSSDEDVIIAATAGGYRLPRNVSLAYLKNIRHIDPLHRTESGQTLVGFALAAYDDLKRRGDDVGASHALDIAAFFISNGAPLEVSDRQGLTVLHVAVLARSVDEVSFLLKHGASPRTHAGPGKFVGMTPLDLARYLARDDQEHSGLVKLLGESDQL